jgi:transcriptional regulator with GAF, ATPase, and Fis domain
MAVPHGERDVGLILFASLNPDQYGDTEIAFVRGVVHGLGPTMARVAKQWHDDSENDGEERLYRRRVEPGRALHDLRDLLTDMADAFGADQSPASLTRGLSRGLASIIPHDRLEVIVPHQGKKAYYRLGPHEEGPLFSHPELVVSEDAFAVDVLFGDEDVLLVDDADTDPRAPVWPFDQADAETIKSVVGIRLGRGNGQAVGYLLLGSQGPGLYRKDDLQALRRLGPLIAPRVDQITSAAEVQTLRGNLGMLRQVPAHLGRIAELLATTAHVGVATRAFVKEAAAVVPFERLDFALRARRENEVIILTPGETRPLRDLPEVDVAGTELGRVLRSEITHTLAAASNRAGSGESAPSAALIVPLRVAGRAIGTMTLVATGSASFGQADVVLAQQLADIAAPHLELLRRAAFSSGTSGSWRRVER